MRIGLTRRALLSIGLIVGSFLLSRDGLNAADSQLRKIVLIAGPKSHGPVGNGIHDYPWSVKLLKVMLDNSNVSGQVRVEYHTGGWPEDESTLEDADTIMVVSDGRDGDKYEEAPHFASAERAAVIQRQIDRGCGFVTFHFSTFAPDEFAEQSFDWTGGYFDWDEDGKWYSAIEVHETEVQPATSDHPLLHGVEPFTMKEEFYFNIRFLEDSNDDSVTPILNVPVLPGREPNGSVVAWAKERADGGRGFATTCGHFYDNWRHADFRKLILNALVWTAGLEPPESGVEACYYTHQEITAAIAGRSGAERAVVDEEPIRVLIFAGNEAHKWHNWEKTTPAIKTQLELDPRIQVDVSNDIEDLARRSLADYDVIVQNSYANWQDPTPLSVEARTSFVNFLQRGGGLLLIHFANGAWHYSLPMAEASDWPEYRNIVRRVWNHDGEGEARSGHDAFGPYIVEVLDVEHPIISGLGDFGIVDELYYRQDGAQPIEPLIAARSKDTGRDEPLAWTYTYGKGRVFQTLLGHSEQTYEAFEACEMLRRAVAWSAARRVVEFDPATAPPEQPREAAQTPPADPSDSTITLTEGRFGNALDARRGGAFLSATTEHRDAPVTVECWARLDSKQGFNILVASEPKSSATHWEMYSYAGTGVFSVYMPGRGGEYRSDVDICDSKWHHLVMTLEPSRIRMAVDGSEVLNRELPGEAQASSGGPLAVGRLVEGGIGCDGLIDELRISRGAHPIEESLETPLPVEDESVGLWRFDALTDDGNIRDESPAGVPLTAVVRAAPDDEPKPEPKKKRGAAALREENAAAGKPNHWGPRSRRVRLVRERLGRRPLAGNGRRRLAGMPRRTARWNGAEGDDSPRRRRQAGNRLLRHRILQTPRRMDGWVSEVQSGPLWAHRHTST